MIQNSRQIRNRRKRGKKEAMDIDITSLLDILVVILIFLLKSYSTTNVIINIPKEINIPKSKSKETNKEGLTLQVSANKIFVEDTPVADLTSNKRVFDDDGLIIIPLLNELNQKKQSIEELAQNGGKPFKGIINLVMDKNINYDFLRKLMYTCGQAGFIKFKFVVLDAEA